MRTILETSFWTRENLLNQLSAAFVDDDVFTFWGMHDSTPAVVRVGSKSAAVWLFRRRTEISATDLALATAGSVWLDSRTAASLGLQGTTGVIGHLEFHFQSLQVQPMRIDHAFTSNHAVVGEDTYRALGSSGGYALIRSDSRCMTVKLERPVGYVQSESKVRLNYHARLLLGLNSSTASARQQLVVHQFDRRLTAARSLKDKVLAALAVPNEIVEKLARLFLNAPVASLVVRSSASADDAMQVVRCSSATIDVIGIEPGDSIRVGWGGSEITVRAFVAESREVSSSDGPEIVAWRETALEDNVPGDSSITIPAGVRAKLGVPRDGVVDVRRSMTGLLRKRAIGLSLPLVGVAISVWGLDIELWIGVGVLVLSGALTLVGDRISVTRLSTRRG